jgi:hypothetical protein
MAWVHKLRPSELKKCNTVQTYIEALQKKSSKSGPVVKLTNCEQGRGLAMAKDALANSRLMSERAIAIINDQGGEKFENGWIFALAIEQLENAHALPVVKDLSNSYEESTSLAEFIRGKVAPTPRDHTQGHASFAESELYGLIGKYCSNAHKWSTDGVITCGIWPMVSMMNHSCDPTVTIVQDEKKQHTIHAFANADLCAGKELTVSYLSAADLEKSVLERKHIIKSNFMFDCACTRCRQDV